VCVYEEGKTKGKEEGEEEEETPEEETEAGLVKEQVKGPQLSLKGGAAGDGVLVCVCVCA
jgi:hypothetical protein